jgi:hypothetical protein
MTATATPVAKGDQIFDGVFEHSLYFRIKMDFDAACRFIHRIDQYNDFDAHSVLDALHAIDRLIPRRYYGRGNPNNGDRKYDISIGREGSPVLYLEWYEWGDDEPLSEHTLKLICAEMQLTGRADEADYSVDPSAISNSHKVTFRFWWD